MIDNLPEPSAVSLDDKDKINAALDSYGALTDSEKSLVYNYDKLASDEQVLNDLVKKDNDKKAAKAVTDMISSLPDPITLKDEEAVNKARAAYDKLTDDQKALVENYDVLVKAMKTIDDLKKQAKDDPNGPTNPGQPNNPGQSSSQGNGSTRSSS